MDMDTREKAHLGKTNEEKEDLELRSESESESEPKLESKSKTELESLRYIFFGHVHTLTIVLVLTAAIMIAVTLYASGLAIIHCAHNNVCVNRVSLCVDRVIEIINYVFGQLIDVSDWFEAAAENMEYKLTVFWGSFFFSPKAVFTDFIMNIGGGYVRQEDQDVHFII